ncbi:endodeoxyribonuclease [Actinomortierella ambigua]|nr:endodeoxyribonuclease [Actinomortierella ambigua]
MERIESTVADILEALTQGKMPQLEIDSRGSGKAMTEFDPCQGIIRRRRSFAATTVDHDRKWDSAGCFGPLRAIHQAGATDHDSVDEDEDLFELYDEDDNTFTPSCTLSPPVVGTLNAEAGSNILRQTKALSTPSQAKGTKILRMTQSGIKQLTSVIRVMDIVHESVQQDVYITKRDVYYRDVATFRRQEVVDRAIDDIASTFKVPRSSLHVVAGSRGLVYGAIRLTTRRHSVLSTTRGKHNKSNVDCKENDPRMISDETSLDGSSWIESSQAHPIPALEELARIEIRSETRFVLVIEKEATMKYLISTNFCRQHGPCILLTGKGHPDRATRQLLNCLSRMVNLGVTVWYPNGVDEELYTDPCCDIRPMAVGTAQNMQARRQPPRQDSRTSPCEPTDTAPQLSTASLIHSCPLLAVVDCDPYGFWIYFTYKHGSPQMAFDNLNLAAPQLRCLGQVPEDWFTCMDAHSADDLSVSEAAIRSTPTRKEFTSDAMAKLSTAARGDGPRTCQSWRRHPLPSILTSTSTLTSHLSQPRPFHPWDRHLLPLTPNDRARLLKLLTMPFVTASIGWRKQLSKMLMMNRKSELQSLYDPSYSTPSLPSASPSSAKEVAISSTPFAHYLVHKLMNERTWL